MVDDGAYIGYECEMIVLDGVPMIVYEQRDFEMAPYAIKFAVLR